MRSRRKWRRRGEGEEEEIGNIYVGNPLPLEVGKAYYQVLWEFF